MSSNLTKDADKVICLIYKDYLDRRKSGKTKSDAKEYDNFEEWSIRLFPDWSIHDLQETVCEICKAFNVPMYMNCGFILDDKIIFHMENRFKNGLKDVISFLSQFIP